MLSLQAINLEDYLAMKEAHPDIAIETDLGRIVLATVCTACEGRGDVQPVPEGMAWVECPICDGKGYILTDNGLAIQRLQGLRA